MKSLSSTEVGGGARGGLSGMAQTLAYKTMSVKQIVAPSLAEESERFRHAMGATAGIILAGYDGKCPEDRGFLYEVKRPDSRRDFDNIIRLVRHARACGRPNAVSDAIKAYEDATAPDFPDECLTEAGFDLEAADVAVDAARTLFAKEPTPARASVLWETLCQLKRQADRCLAQAARVMHLPSRSRA